MPSSGRFIETVAGSETVRAFVPDPLPPEPPLRLDGLLERLSRADRALGRLDGITLLVPDHKLFLYMYVRKEAVLSSQIEGTQSTLSDLLRFEATAEAGQPLDDIREVSNYVDAMMHGLKRLDALPLSLRLIREMHARLLQAGRGARLNPGEFRRSQNWVGGTRPGNALYVPPPVSELDGCLDAFERFLHASDPTIPALVKAGLLHVQFESIHPFLDGNGRLGRLLITLWLCATGVTREPLLYLSLYFRQHRETYYELLQQVRQDGAWEAWLEFFLDGVIHTAEEAFTSSTRIVDLFRRDRERIAAHGDRSGSVLRLHELMQTKPFFTSKLAQDLTGLTAPTVNAAIETLSAIGIVEEITGRKRNRVFAYRAFLDILADRG